MTFQKTCRNAPLTFLFVFLSSLITAPARADEAVDSKVKVFELNERLDTFDKCVSFFGKHLRGYSEAGLEKLCEKTREDLTDAEKTDRINPNWGADIYATTFDLNNDGIDDILYSVSDQMGTYYCGNQTCHLFVIFRLPDSNGKPSYRGGYISGHGKSILSYKWHEDGAMGSIEIPTTDMTDDGKYSFFKDVADVFYSVEPFTGD